MPRLMLTDEHWTKIRLIMLQYGIYDKPNLRITIEGILYRMRVGCPWRDLPTSFGAWNSIFQQFNRWSLQNKWIDIFKSLIQNPDLEWEFINGIMHLNDAGRMVQTKIANTPNCYPGVSIDLFIVMPDHVHAIIVLDGPGRTQGSAPTDFGLSEIVKNIKTCTTRNYIQGVHQNHWQPFHKRLWQRGYYERIIRNPNNLNNVREYIINNPATWHRDK